jgi:DNA-binding transcriptional LysR family regulator
MFNFSYTLRQLQYFDAVASAGSLSAAAAQCNVSATALSLALDELERHLGVQLFVRRKGKGVVLAPAGSRLLGQARQLLVGAETLAAEADQTATTLTGRFAVGCFSTLTPFFLPGVMGRFQEEHPGLDLEFFEATAPALHEYLLQGRIDAALLYSVDVSPQLAFEPLHEYLPHVIVAEDHALAAQKSVSLRDLSGVPLIQLDLHPSRQNTEKMFASLGLTPSIRYTTTNYELARCLVGRGLGYSIMFQKPASNLTYDGHVVRTVALDDSPAPTVVGLARPSGAPRTAKYLTLRNFISSQATAGSPR